MKFKKNLRDVCYGPLYKTATSVEDFCRRLHRNHTGVEFEQWAVTDSESEDDNEDMAELASLQFTLLINW